MIFENNLVYYPGLLKSSTTHHLSTVEFDWHNDRVSLATWLREFTAPPPLDKLLAWQSFIVDLFPEVEWNASPKIDMRQTDSEDRPDIVSRYKGTNRRFTVTLKGTLKQN